jgi:hypothetical protein
VTDAEKLKADAASPASPLVPVDTAQAAAAAPFEPEDAAGKATHAGINTCAACRHLLPRGTCASPIKAGLIPEAEGYGIAWPPEGHAAECAAFEGKPAAPPLRGRPHMPTHVEADAAHANRWTTEQIIALEARRDAIRRLGFNADNADNAEDLAERLHLRDMTADHHITCMECSHLAGAVARWRCSNHAAAGVGRDLPAELVTTGQACSVFEVLSKLAGRERP